MTNFIFFLDFRTCKNIKILDEVLFIFLNISESTYLILLRGLWLISRRSALVTAAKSNFTNDGSSCRMYFLYADWVSIGLPCRVNFVSGRRLRC